MRATRGTSTWTTPGPSPGCRSGELPPGERRVVPDEIHKYARRGEAYLPHWRNHRKKMNLGEITLTPSFLK